MIDSVIYFSQTALKMKLYHVEQVLNTHNASEEIVEKSVGPWLHRTQGRANNWPHSLRGEGGCF